jgi:hypothetical protein
MNLPSPAGYPFLNDLAKRRKCQPSADREMPNVNAWIPTHQVGSAPLTRKKRCFLRSLYSFNAFARAVSRMPVKMAQAAIL